ncbi:MAG: hypothetical protein ABFD12_02125 [Syntrophorhabdus sp.]
MALPIACTPVLRGKIAKQFLEQIKAQENDRKPLVPTPNLDAVREAILADARTKKK